MIDTSTEPIGLSLMQRQYGLVEFEVSELMEVVFKGWTEFLTEPVPYRETFSFGDPSDPDDGYQRRDGDARPGGGRYDDKYFFHYTPNLWALLNWRKTDYARHQQWLLACHELYMRSLAKTAEIYASIDEAIPGIEVGVRLRDPRALWKTRLRLLNYKQVQSPGEVLAKFHADRDFITLHLGENWKGLCIDPDGSDRQSYEAQPGKVLVFPGSKAPALTGGLLKPLIHGVVAPDDSVEGLQRQSAVFFTHASWV